MKSMNLVKNKTIIGLKCSNLDFCLPPPRVKNKTIIGLKSDFME